MTETAARTSHRLTNLRRYTAGCSCEAVTYVTEATDREEAAADLRGQHRDHKANPMSVVAKKAPARKAAATKARTEPAPVAAKPRPRRAAKATAA